MYNLSGPVAVAGAEPGDTLCIDILDLEHGSWGWSAILPGFGLLPEDFTSGYVRTFDLAGKDAANFGDGITIPLHPFMGTMGVHPGGGVRLSPFPPHVGGGNIDNRHLTAGSRLYLPVFLKGALFSCGDAHAAQGDGEVCVTGIECAMRATLRLSLQQRSLSAPSFRTPRPVVDPGPYHGTMGIHPELMEGARLAVRSMIDWLADEHGLSREDAYVLCSLAGDLRIHEIVDAGVWNVGMTMPLSVFA